MRGSRPSASSRVALLEGQFVLHYQPKIAVGTGETFGAEALVRWQHPTRGLLYPDAFLEIVEQSGSIGRLTQIVLELAVRQLPSGTRPASRSAWRSTSRRPTSSMQNFPSAS